MTYKLIIKRVDSDTEEYFTYDDLNRGLDLFELEKGNPTIDRLHLIDEYGKIYGSWGQRPVHKPLTELVNQVEQARQRYEDVGEWFVEIRSEYYNEVSLYGDAWVGARDQLDRAYRACGDAEEEYKALQAKLPPVHTCEPPAVVEEECPF
jgi:hypothetical protein